MSDVRALLRQQREARRITHPLAFYSDAGKLICTACREIVKAEALWNMHLNSESHQARVKQPQDAHSPAPNDTTAAGPVDMPSPLLSVDGSVSSKRKLPFDEGDETGPGDDAGDDGVRKKRSKADMGSPEAPGPASDTGPDKHRKEQNVTPLVDPNGRWLSGTPAQGVEINMPSRPATPAAPRDGSLSSASSTGPLPPAPNAEAAAILSRRRTVDSNMSATSAPPPETPTAAAAGGGGDVDEAEWAAFEADIAAASAEYDEDAVISAPAMTAEEAAAARNKAEGGLGDTGEQRVSGEKLIMEEREDAARAFEEELEEMNVLEERLRKLKDRREALRGGGGAGSQAVVEAGENMAHVPSVEGPNGDNNDQDEDGDDDDDDYDDDDDWNGFRVRR